jgi:hypothetical protein
MKLPALLFYTNNNVFFENREGEGKISPVWDLATVEGGEYQEKV